MCDLRSEMVLALNLRSEGKYEEQRSAKRTFIPVGREEAGIIRDRRRKTEGECRKDQTDSGKPKAEPKAVKPKG